MAQQQITRMKGLFLEGGTVARNEEPVADLAAQHLNLSDRREFSAEGRIGRASGVRENEPDAVVPGRFEMVAQHEDDAVSAVDGKSGEHPTHVGVKRPERFEDEWKGRLLLDLRRARHLLGP